MALLILEWEPLEAPPGAHGAEASTWASLRIAVRNGTGREVVLTRLLDKYSKTVRQHVDGTVLPLVEWIVRSWSHILSSRRRRQPSGGDYLWERVHSWRYAGEGTALPNARFYSGDDAEIHLHCESDVDEDTFERVQFLSRGTFSFSHSAVRRSLDEFVQAILRRMQQTASEDPRTQELLDNWDLVTNPEAPDFAAQQLAARLGELWWDLEEENRREIRTLSKSDNPVLITLAEAASLQQLAQYRRIAETTWARCQSVPPASKALESLRARLLDISGRCESASPWDVGWQAARGYRELLGSRSDQPLPDLKSAFWDQVNSSEDIDGFDAVIAWRPSGQPIRLLPRFRRLFASSPFANYRDLYPVLFCAGDQRQVTVHSRAIAGSASIANAFAAELVAPVENLRKALAGIGIVDLDLLDDLARELNAPLMCVRHQIENHHLAQVALSSDSS